jgi:hypothetical protein
VTVSKDEILNIGNSELYEFTKDKRDEAVSVLKETLHGTPEDKKSKLKSLTDLDDSELEEP